MFHVSCYVLAHWLCDIKENEQDDQPRKTEPAIEIARYFSLSSLYFRIQVRIYHFTHNIICMGFR
jgi:hypothetical protein